MPRVETKAVVWYTDKKPSARGQYMRVDVNERLQDSDLEGETSDISSRLQKETILRWFHQSHEHDAAWVLERLVENMPTMVFAAVSGKINNVAVPATPVKEAPRLVRTSQTAKQRHSQRQSIRLPQSGGVLAGNPIVQFASPVFYAEEGVDDIMVLDVMRIGNQSGISEVYYETEDDSALNGRSFIATSGKLVFMPGETLAHIKVPIIDNPLWDTTTEFKCLLKPEGLKGAVLGRYLYYSRVKIIDSNAFPTSAFEHVVSEEDAIKCNKWQLLRGFLNLASNIPSVWSGTVKFIVVDTFHNLMYMLELFMSVYILDYILDTSVSVDDLVLVSNRLEALILCCIINVVCIAFAHFLDYSRQSFTIIAPSRNFLQRALLRKFLNYTNVVRERLPPGRVMVSMERDVTDLVLEGFLNTLKILKAVGKIFLMLCFKLLSPVVFGGNYDWHASLLLLVVPIVVMVFLEIREETTGRCLLRRNNCHSSLTNQISTTTTNFHLVIDYALRNHCEHKFCEKQREYGMAAMSAGQVNENNEYFCKWCQATLILIWFLYGGDMVIQGSLTLGFFATNLTLFRDFGREFLELYSITVSMMHTFPALEHITTLMNEPTDVRQRYRIERQMRAEAKSKRSFFRNQLELSGMQSVPVDLMPIVLNFQRAFKFEGKDRTLNFMGKVEIPQGQLIAVVGSMGCGKATLLRLIAGSVLPSESMGSPIFVPSHLRVANVADEPLFFGGTLYENLIFGMDPTKADASRARVRSICRRLTKSHTIADYLDVDDERRWQDIFSGAQSKLLSIARALIHNAEILCIHKPLVKLNQNDAEHVITALHDHLVHKGLELDSDTEQRRPRTVFLSAATDRAIKEADNVLTIDVTTGISLLLPE